MSYVFFFFQAEDGIRDYKVTGVQTCALPILANGFLSGKYNEDSVFPTGDIRHNFPQEYVRQLIRTSDQLKFLESKQRTLSQASIRFVLDHKEISTVIPGAKVPAQSTQNMKTSNLPSLTGEELLRIKFMREQTSWRK